VVAAVECAIAIQTLMVERNADTPEDKRILYRIGVNLGDVLIEGDDILGDGVNIAARLEGLCEPGGVLISGTAYYHVCGKIDAHFVDLGDKDLKNVVRPVRVYALNTGSKLSPTALPAFESERRGSPRLSIVVLPFANIGGDPEQDYFVDGVTESLTTDLSRISGAFVIGRSTAFTYKGKAVELKQIGRELNVRYVLEGSVQRGGNRMRVNVQLIDAELGNHAWRNASKSLWPTSWTCKTKSSRGSAIRSTRNSSPPRRAARSKRQTQTQWTSIFREWLGSIRERRLST
jgi:TolB-like protein